MGNIDRGSSTVRVSPYLDVRATNVLLFCVFIIYRKFVWWVERVCILKLWFVFTWRQTWMLSKRHHITLQSLMEFRPHLLKVKAHPSHNPLHCKSLSQDLSRGIWIIECFLWHFSKYWSISLLLFFNKKQIHIITMKRNASNDVRVESNSIIS